MYGKIVWLDHFANPSSTFNVKQNADGTITLTPAGEVIQQGTPLSAGNFNRIEYGVLDAHLAHRLLSLASKSLSGSDGVTEAIESALQAAKESGEFDGEKGDKGDKGDTGATGATGPAGANATINGVNALTITVGGGIKATQNGDKLHIETRYTYGTTDIVAGSASSATNGTLHFVYE